MSKRKFAVGDVVIATGAQDGNGKVVGHKGTIRTLSEARYGYRVHYGVEFRNNVMGHQVNVRRCKPGHGWWMDANNLKLIRKKK